MITPRCDPSGPRTLLAAGIGLVSGRSRDLQVTAYGWGFRHPQSSPGISTTTARTRDASTAHPTTTPQPSSPSTPRSAGTASSAKRSTNTAEQPEPTQNSSSQAASRLSARYKTSSPAARRYPHPGCSRAMRRTTARIEGRVGGRPSRSPREGPPALDKISMPAQQRARCHEQVPATGRGEHSGQGANDGSISPRRSWAGDLTPSTVSWWQHQDLGVLGGV